MMAQYDAEPNGRGRRPSQRPLGDRENKQPVISAFLAMIMFAGQDTPGRPGDWPPTGTVVGLSFVGGHIWSPPPLQGFQLNKQG